MSKAQYLLARWLILPSDQIDGSFGPATTHAVQEFQADEGLTVDGVVDTNTWQALLAGFRSHLSCQQDLRARWSGGSNER